MWQKNPFFNLIIDIVYNSMYFYFTYIASQYISHSNIWSLVISLALTSISLIISVIKNLDSNPFAFYSDKKDYLIMILILIIFILLTIEIIKNIVITSIVVVPSSIVILYIFISWLIDTIKISAFNNFDSLNKKQKDNIIRYLNDKIYMLNDEDYLNMKNIIDISFNKKALDDIKNKIDSKIDDKYIKNSNNKVSLYKKHLNKKKYNIFLFK